MYLKYESCRTKTLPHGSKHETCLIDCCQHVLHEVEAGGSCVGGPPELQLQVLSVRGDGQHCLHGVGEESGAGPPLAQLRLARRVLLHQVTQLDLSARVRQQQSSCFASGSASEHTHEKGTKSG